MLPFVQRVDSIQSWWAEFQGHAQWIVVSKRRARKSVLIKTTLEIDEFQEYQPYSWHHVVRIEGSNQ